MKNENWISCQELLPYNNERVLVNIRYPLGRVKIEIDTFHRASDGSFWQSEQGRWSLGKVTHWMSLPQHPQ